MNTEFAACDRRRALEFIKLAYPSKEITDTQESAGQLLDFVEKGIVRVTNPFVHAGDFFEVRTGENWVESREIRGQIKDSLRLFCPAATIQKEDDE